MLFDIRECYRNGIVKEQDKLYEFHVFCECDKCKWRYKYLKEPRNQLTITTDSKDKFNQIKEFIENWKCKDGDKNLPTEYIRFYEMKDTDLSIRKRLRLHI
jgi:hypothetical protein